MPQDGLRSSIYRSFVTCNDPKGVISCRTIIKSKSYSQKMNHHKRERQRKLKSLSTPSLNYEPELEEIIMASSTKEIPEEIHSPAAFQLMEVSKGAKKLNHMIDSWTKGVKFDGQSKDMAKDLLKGALDLQDSLVMLGKLQEASQYMAHLKKKQIEKNERGKEDDEPWIRRTSSDQFRDHFSVTSYQKPRLSVDGYPSNSTEELKKVIKESLVSQNLLPKARKHHHQKTHYFPHLDSASTSESPSATSSTSQSSMARVTTNSPTASTSVSPQTTKGLNLIARLMGLEECPLKPLQITPQKKTPNQLEPVLDIDKPKVKTSQCRAQKTTDPERKTLDEILENMQYKGLLRSSKAAKEVQLPCLDDLNVSRSRQRLLSDNGPPPPIVLMKPLRVPFQVPKETNRPVFEEDDPLYRRKMLRKLRRKQELYPKGINYKDGNLKSGMVVSRRPNGEETRIRGIKEEAAKDKRVVVETPVDHKEVGVNETSVVVKLKAYQSVNQKQQKSEDIDNRANENILKVTTANKKSLDKDVVKTRSVPKSQVQAKKTLNKAVKPESESNMARRKEISRQPSTKPGSIKNAEQGAACNSIYQRKNRLKKGKPVNKPTASKTVAETCVREVDEKMDDTREIDCHVVRVSSSVLEQQLPKLEDQPLEEESIDSSGSHIRELGKEGKISPLEIILPTPSANDEMDTKKEEKEEDEEALKTIDVCEITYDKTSISETSLRDVLLSSLSFQSCAEELFDVNMNNSSSTNIIQCQTSCIDDFEAQTLRLPLECAKEIMERKSFQGSQTIYPLLPCIAKSRISISMEMLVEDVMKGIESLAIYRKLGGEDLVDCLYAMLERDLMCNGVVNGIWDSGWKTGFSLDEAEQVVNDIEKLVLTGLIEEVFV
ncbi:hypothetical protein CsatB_010177 [Cannabis sativa]